MSDTNSQSNQSEESLAHADEEVDREESLQREIRASDEDASSDGSDTPIPDAPKPMRVTLTNEAMRAPKPLNLLEKADDGTDLRAGTPGRTLRQSEAEKMTEQQARLNRNEDRSIKSPKPVVKSTDGANTAGNKEKKK